MSSFANPAQGLVPNFNAWLGTAWGSGADFYNAGCLGWFSTATNLVFGQNPPYYLDDFAAMFPKFFGAPTLFANGVVAVGSSQITVPSTAGVLPGMFLVCAADFPKGTLVTAVTPTVITVNNAATASDASASFLVYEAPPVPVAIVQLYLNLANSSLVEARWQEQWYIAMGWFIAHYLTLYARSDAAEVVTALQQALHTETPVGAVPGTVYTLSEAPPGGVLDGFFVNGLFQRPNGLDYTLVGATVTLNNSTAEFDTVTATWAVQQTVQTSNQPSTAQLAAQGLLNGILTSKSVGDVSASYSVLEEQAGWGTFRMTMYGAQLIDMAKVVGMGPMVIW